MIKVPENTEITPELVDAIIKKHKTTYLPRLQRLRKYYDAQHDILNRTKDDDTKANNKLINNYCKYITNVATGYFMGKSVSYSSNDTEYMEELTKIFDDNFEDDVNFEVAKEMSINGVGYEFLYTNENSDIKFKKVDTENTIPVFGYSLSSYILFAIRYYTQTSIISGETTEIAEVYTEKEIIKYKKVKKDNDEAGKYEEIDRTAHIFGDVPIIEYKNNDERKGDFEEIISLNDEYNKTQSDTANDFEEFTDAYLTLVGFEASDGDDIKRMKEDRVLLLKEQGQAKWLIKTINDTALENFKKRISTYIHKFGQVPDLSDEQFAGNLSGVAIRFKLWPLEQLAGTKERKFDTALKKRIEIITNFLNLKKNTSYDYKTVNTTFHRNIPQNEIEITNMIKGLTGLLSEKTQLEQLPMVKDVDEEMDRKKKEQQEISNEYEDIFKREALEQAAKDADVDEQE